ncbi:MAG: HNH endonuclease [Arthrobacter sp.]|nr:HNH endonuclease [Arthrobacter sp.]
MKRDGFHCQICGATGKTAELVLDHIVPVSKGGGTEKENLQTVCHECNQGKSNRP